MIRHTVTFRLRHASGSPEEQSFIAAARVLADIPGVANFEQLRQLSNKNEYSFGFSMEFEDDAAYQAYNVHPVHAGFVADRWVPEVEDFLELDYALL
jgi:hypothetical protein